MSRARRDRQEGIATFHSLCTATLITSDNICHIKSQGVRYREPEPCDVNITGYVRLNVFQFPVACPSQLYQDGCRQRLNSSGLPSTQPGSADGAHARLTLHPRKARMNTARSRARRQQNLQAIEQPPIAPKVRPAKEPPESISPDKLPNPWLADSEWLLEELAKAREDALRIPWTVSNASHINSVVDRLWRLEQLLRYLLHLHREGQRSFAKQAQEAAPKPATARKVMKPNIVRIRA